jgi:DNA-binding response OmpR family regulator
MFIWQLKHVLLISYDEQLLIARRILLEKEGYKVSSALGFKEAIANCSGGSFDLVVLGHSIPPPDKGNLIKAFRVSSGAPILSLWAKDECIANSVDYLAFSEAPDKLLQNVAAILSRKTATQTAD